MISQEGKTFQDAINNFYTAAKNLDAAWDNYNPNLEFDTYPFEENFNILIEKINSWRQDIIELIKDFDEYPDKYFPH